MGGCGGMRVGVGGAGGGPGVGRDSAAGGKMETGQGADSRVEGRGETGMETHTLLMGRATKWRRTRARKGRGGERGTARGWARASGTSPSDPLATPCT